MVRFIESIKFDPAFAKAIYDVFYDPEDKRLDLRGGRFKPSWKGWPDSLSIENLEVVSIGSDYLVFVSGGDWQEMIPVKLRLKPNTNKLEWKPFESYTKNSATEIKLGCQDLINCAEGQINEDCQIAGPMMGDVPQNVGSVLSLGYKSGRVLTPPKKIAGAKDYSSIPKDF
jgi:hypothetical protein